MAPVKRRQIPCLNCGTLLWRFPSQIRPRTFCSRECASRHGRVAMTCQWHGCQETFDAHLSTHHGRTVYKIRFSKTASYSCFPYCERHRLLLKRYGMRAYGLHRIWQQIDRDRGIRAISSKGVRLVLFDRAEGRCQSCGTALEFLAPPKTWIVDHVVPVFKGGTTEIANLQLLCKACDDIKTGREKSEVALSRWYGTHDKIGRWLTHWEKDALIANLRRQLAEALAKSAT